MENGASNVPRAAPRRTSQGRARLCPAASSNPGTMPSTPAPRAPTGGFPVVWLLAPDVPPPVSASVFSPVWELLGKGPSLPCRSTSVRQGCPSPLACYKGLITSGGVWTELSRQDYTPPPESPPWGGSWRQRSVTSSRLEAAHAAREQTWGQARQEGTLEEHTGSILTTLPSQWESQGFPFLHQNGPKNPSLWGSRISISGKLTLVISSPWISPGRAAVWGSGPGRVKPNPLN